MWDSEALLKTLNAKSFLKYWEILCTFYLSMSSINDLCIESETIDIPVAPKPEGVVPSSPSDGIFSPSSEMLRKKKMGKRSGAIRSNSFTSASVKVSDDEGEIDDKKPIRGIRRNTIGSSAASVIFALGPKSPTDDLLSPTSKKVNRPSNKSRVISNSSSSGKSSLFALKSSNNFSEDSDDSDRELRRNANTFDSGSGSVPELTLEAPSHLSSTPSEA